MDQAATEELFCLFMRLVMEFDFTTAVISGAMCIAGLVYILRNPHKWTNYKGYRGCWLFIRMGIITIIATTFLNSLVENAWGVNQIADFLRLRIAGRWAFRVIASFGYMFIIWGVFGFLMLVMRSKKQDDSAQK